MSNSSIFDPLSTLPSNGPVNNVCVLDNVKRLAAMCKSSKRGNNCLSEIVSDIELLRNESEDPRTKAIIDKWFVSMLNQVKSINDPCMIDFFLNFWHDNFRAQQLVLMSTLVNIARDLILHMGPDNCTTIMFNPNDGYYDVDLEMKFALPRKYKIRGSMMQKMTSNIFDANWMLMKLEFRIRKDSINPLRKLDFSCNNDLLKLAKIDYEQDIDYLRRCYHEDDPNVLHRRWLWGRKMWTLNGRSQSYIGWDDKTVIEQGRGMEMNARSLLFKYGIISEN